MHRCCRPHYAVRLEVNGCVMEGASARKADKANAEPMRGAVPQANGLLKLPV